jgi:hypothetical protein
VNCAYFKKRKGYDISSSNTPLQKKLLESNRGLSTIMVKAKSHPTHKKSPQSTFCYVDYHPDELVYLVRT